MVHEQSAVAVSTTCWTIREQCGRPWDNELLHFSLQWGTGQQRQADLVVVGPFGILPSQVSDITYHPDGSLAAAVVWCRVSLQPEEVLELRLETGVSPAHVALPTWEADHCGGIIAANGIIAVRLPASGTYSAAAAPGPVMALRLENGVWVGQGSVQASRDVHIATELREHGPLFLRWVYRAYYERRTLATVECTLYAGEKFVRMKEVTSYDSDLTFLFDTYAGLRPDCLLHHGGGECSGLALSEIDYARAEELCVVDFNSGHQQMGNAWYGVYHAGSAPLIGVVEIEGCTWTNTSVNRLFLRAAPPESLHIASPWRGGVKEWALVITTAAANLKPADSRACIELSTIHQRYVEVPLQKIKDWVLEWEGSTSARPFLQGDMEAIAGARAHVLASPEYACALRSMQSDGAGCSKYATLWVAFGDTQYARQAVASLEQAADDAMAVLWNEGALMRMNIFYGRAMKMWLQSYDVLMAGGFIDAALDRKLRRHFALLAYAMADPAFFPKQYNLSELHHPDSFQQGLGQLIGDTMCPPNFHTEYFTTYGMMGCCFPEHPMAAAWRHESIAMMEQMLDVHFADSGCYSESPNYHSHVLAMETQLALTLRRLGEKDLFQHPRLKAQYDYFCRMQTPPILLSDSARAVLRGYVMLDREAERLAMLPSNGNSGNNCSDMPLPAELAVAAAIYRESDPALSARCMTTWRRGGRLIASSCDDLTFLLVADLELPGSATAGLGSTVLTGSFVTFRGNPETADEVFVLTKNGSATHHNCFDEGGFTIWAYGAPVCGDFGYHAVHEGRHGGGVETWKHNCVEFDGKSSGYQGIEAALPPERWISTELADLLVSDLGSTNLREMPPMNYWDQVPIEPIEYRRYTLFVKPHYLLVFDSILHCAYSHRWWLHAQASDLAIDGPRVRFTGKFGVDLLAHFITPAAPVLSAGEWSVMRHITAQQTRAKDWRVFVAPARPEQDFAVTSTLVGRVVTVDTPEYQDTLLLAHYPFHYEDEVIRFAGKAGVVRRMKESGDTVVSLLDGEMLDLV